MKINVKNTISKWENTISTVYNLVRRVECGLFVKQEKRVFEFWVSTCYADGTMEMNVKNTISIRKNTTSTVYKLVGRVESGHFVKQEKHVFVILRFYLLRRSYNGNECEKHHI